MPLVTINVSEKVPDATRHLYADEINKALVEALGVDPHDRFQVINPVPEGSVIADPHYLGANRIDPIIITILFYRMYTEEQKNKASEAIAARLEVAGVRPDDVFLAYYENFNGDWYPGACGKRG